MIESCHLIADIGDFPGGFFPFSDGLLREWPTSPQLGGTVQIFKFFTKPFFSRESNRNPANWLRATSSPGVVRRTCSRRFKVWNKVPPHIRSNTSYCLSIRLVFSLNVFLIWWKFCIRSGNQFSLTDIFPIIYFRSGCRTGRGTSPEVVENNGSRSKLDFPYKFSRGDLILKSC